MKESILNKRMDEISKFRKNRQDRFASTIHRCSFSDFLILVEPLKKKYIQFDVVIKGDKVSITIPMYGGRQLNENI